MPLIQSGVERSSGQKPDWVRAAQKNSVGVPDDLKGSLLASGGVVIVARVGTCARRLADPHVRRYLAALRHAFHDFQFCVS